MENCYISKVLSTHYVSVIHCCQYAFRILAWLHSFCNMCFKNILFQNLFRGFIILANCFLVTYQLVQIMITLKDMIKVEHAKWKQVQFLISILSIARWRQWKYQSKQSIDQLRNADVFFSAHPFYFCKNS